MVFMHRVPDEGRSHFTWAAGTRRGATKGEL